jgi:two-component system chemotaxis response regulator CheB
LYRVLVVDDSKIARELLVEILSSDPEINIVGCAKNGREAVRMTDTLHPQVITMDIHMPDMNGFEATKEIMMSRPTPIIIVSASASVQEVETVMQAMRNGALTVRMKPPGPNSPEFDRASRDLIETVKTMAEVKVIRHHRRELKREAVPTGHHPVPKPDVGAIAIAASTGGPPALQCLLEGLPADFPAPILVVQHIAKGFVDGFATWLDTVVSLSTKVAENHEPLLPGTIYVAPHDQHLGVSRSGKVALSSAPAVGGFRPAASHLFQSVAEAFGDKAVAVILTGMGSDGVQGLHTVRDKGGLVVAQDKDTSVVFGMPGVAVSEGLTDEVLPIGAMSEYLLELVGRKP